ncbi:MAG: tetratricopeptide repeat protein [Treponema sp.]|nr:tetratricopeptide repeat protein [Candidatus Treponema merdequi]
MAKTTAGKKTKTAVKSETTQKKTAKTAVKTTTSKTKKTASKTAAGKKPSGKTETSGSTKKSAAKKTAPSASVKNTAVKKSSALSEKRTLSREPDTQVTSEEIKALWSVPQADYEAQKKESEMERRRNNRRYIVRAGIAGLIVLLILFFIIRGCSHSHSSGGGMSAKERQNTISVVKKYLDKGQYDSAKDLLNRLLIENPEDEEVNLLWEELIKAMEESEKDGNTIIVNGGQSSQPNYDININTDEITNAFRETIDSMSKELSAANEQNAKNQEALNRLLEQQRQDEAERKAQEKAKAEQKKADEEKQKAKEEELAKQNKKVADKIAKINELINQGNQNLNTGKSDMALKKYADAISLLPIEQGEPAFSGDKYAEVASNLYDAAERETNPQNKTVLMNNAVKYAQKAVQNDPNNARAHFILAMNAENEKNSALAEKELELAAQNDPNNYLYYYYLGRRQQINKKYSQARASYNTSIKLNKNFESSHFNLGLTCKQLGLNQDALTAFRNAHSVNPNHAKAYLEEARILFRNYNDAAGAIKPYEEVIRIEPDNVSALKECGSVYASMEKYSKAEELFKRAVSKLGTAEDPLTYYNLSTVMFNQNKVEDALKYAEKAYSTKTALRTSKEQAMVVYNYGLISQKNGDETKAITLYREALTLDENHSKAMTNLGIMFLDMNPPDADSALNFLTKAYNLDTGSFEINNNLGSAYLMKKDYANAINYYLKAVKINPKDNKVRTNLAKAQAESGEFDSARVTYQEVIKQKPDNYDAYIELAKVCIALKDTVSAEGYLQALQVKKPEYRTNDVKALLETVRN